MAFSCSNRAARRGVAAAGGVALLVAPDPDFAELPSAGLVDCLPDCLLRAWLLFRLPGAEGA